MKAKAPSAGSFICHDCVRLKKCGDTAASWVLFFIALIAVVSLRAVNMVMDASPFWAKAFWYIGIIGFIFFFAYKYRYDRDLQRELRSSGLQEKLFDRVPLSEHDYDLLATIVCKLRSKKDGINYFFIFASSAVALVWAVYLDFIRR